MGRKSTIDQRSDEFRKHVFRALRENRLTLDELRAELEAEFPDEPTPSRSALGRHRASVEEMISHEREMAAAADATLRPQTEEGIETVVWCTPAEAMAHAAGSFPTVRAVLERLEACLSDDKKR